MMPAKFLEPDQWGPGYVYATPRIKASSLYQDALAAEVELARDYPTLFTGPVDPIRATMCAMLWHRAGFYAWADNYMAAAARAKVAA